MYQQPQYPCPRCGAPIQAGQPTCSNCGLPLDPASIAAFQQSQQRAPYPVAPAPRRGPNVLLIVLAVVGALVLACVLAGIVGALFTPATVATQTQASATTRPVALAPQATATTAPPPPTATTIPAPPATATGVALPPSATPAPAPPTPTHAPPTARPTVRPTATRPAPTDTPASGLSPAEDTYRQAVGTESQQIGEGLQTISTESSADDLFSQRWVISVAVGIAEVNNAADEGLALKAPARFKQFDTTYKSGLRHYKSAMDLYIRGVDGQNAGLIHQAITQMDQGSAAMSTATTELTDLLP